MKTIEERRAKGDEQVTPHDVANFISEISGKVSPWNDRTPLSVTLDNRSRDICLRETPERTAAITVLTCADLMLEADEYEERSRRLRKWAQELGDG